MNRANSFRPFYAQAITWTVVLSTIVFLLYAAFPAPVNAEPDFRESPKFIKEAGRIEALIDAAVNQEKPCKCDVRKLLKLLQELLENEEQLKRKNADISQSLAKTRQKLLEAAEQESRSGETSFTKTVAWSALNLLMDVTLDQADKAFDFGTKSLNELGTGIRTVKGGARVAGKFLGKGASKGGQIGKVAYDYLGSAGANADRLKKYPELNAAEASIRKMGENQAESMENKRLEQLIWNKILGSPGCLEALNTQCSLADIEYVSKRGVLNQLDKVSYPYLNFVIHDIERVADTYGYRAFPGKDYEEKGFSHAELKKYVMPKLELYQYFDEQAYKYNAVAGQSIAAAGRASEKCNTCKMLKALKGLSDLKSEIDVLENDWKGVYVGTIRGVIGSHKALAKMWAAKGSPAKITSHPLYQLEGLALSLVSVTTPVGTAMSAAAAVSEISQAVGDLVFKAPVTEDIKRQAKLMKVFADSLNNSIGALADTSNRIEKARADLIRRLFDCNKIKTCPKEKPVSYPAPQYRSVERHPVAIPGHGSLSPGAKKAAGVLIPGYGGPGADCVSLANELRSLEKQRKQLNQRAARLHKEWVKAYNRIPKLEKEIEELAGYIKDASQLMGWGYYVGGTKEGVLAKLKEWKEEKGRKESLAHQLRIREAKLRYQKEQLSKRERNLHNHIAQVRRALDNCGKKAPEPNQPPAKQAKTTPVQPVRLPPHPPVIVDPSTDLPPKPVRPKTKEKKIKITKAMAKLIVDLGGSTKKGDASESDVSDSEPVHDVKKGEDLVNGLARLNKEMAENAKKTAAKKASSSSPALKIGGCVFPQPKLSNYRKGLAGMPDDIPELPGATFGESYDHNTGQSFHMGSMKSPVSLKSSYKKQLQKNGWKILKDDVFDTQLGPFQRLFAKSKNACISVVAAKAPAGRPNKSVLAIYTYPGPGKYKPLEAKDIRLSTGYVEDESGRKARQADHPASGNAGNICGSEASRSAYGACAKSYRRAQDILGPCKNARVKKYLKQLRKAARAYTKSFRAIQDEWGSLDGFVKRKQALAGMLKSGSLNYKEKRGIRNEQKDMARLEKRVGKAADKLRKLLKQSEKMRKLCSGQEGRVSLPLPGGNQVTVGQPGVAPKEGGDAARSGENNAMGVAKDVGGVISNAFAAIGKCKKCADLFKQYMKLSDRIAQLEKDWGPYLDGPFGPDEYKQRRAIKKKLDKCLRKCEKKKSAGKVGKKGKGIASDNAGDFSLSGDSSCNPAASDVTNSVIRPMPKSEKTVNKAKSAVSDFAKGAVGSLFGVGGSKLGGMFGRGGGQDGARTVKRPVVPFYALSNGETGVEVGGWVYKPRSKKKKPEIRIAQRIKDSPDKGAPHMMLLQNRDGRILRPIGYMIFELWRHWKLTITITRDTWVNGEHTSHTVTRESTQWNELAERYRKIMEAPGIWEQFGLSPFGKLRGVIARFPLPEHFNPAQWTLVKHDTAKAMVNGREVIKTVPFVISLGQGKKNKLTFKPSADGKTAYQREHGCQSPNETMHDLMTRYWPKNMPGKPQKKPGKYKVKKAKMNAERWAGSLKLQPALTDKWLKGYRKLSRKLQQESAVVMANIMFLLATGSDAASPKQWFDKFLNLSEQVKNLAISAANRWKQGMDKKQMRKMARAYSKLTPGLQRLFRKEFTLTLATNLFLDLRQSNPVLPGR